MKTNSLVIAGFHRSGTSMVTQLFHSSGLFIGDKLLAGSESNPYGHFEDEEVVHIHDDILKRHGCDWMVKDQIDFEIGQPGLIQLINFIRKRNAIHHTWGFKDPRVCLFIKDWQKLMPNSSFVVIFRDFLSTTNSLLSRQSRDILLKKGSIEKHMKLWIDPEYAYKMWLAHNVKLVEFVKAFPERSLVLTHQQILGGVNPVDLAKDRFSIDLASIEVQNYIDNSVITSIDVKLPPISPTLHQRLIGLWNEISSITNDHSINIEKQINKFTFSQEDSPLQEDLFDSYRGSSSSRYLEAKAKHKQLLRELKSVSPVAR